MAATGSEGSLATGDAAGAGAGRRVLSASNSLVSSADSRGQRGKLERLRAAVEALEADAAEGRLGKRRVAGRAWDGARHGCLLLQPLHAGWPLA